MKSDKDVVCSLPHFSSVVDDSPGILVQTGKTLLYGFSIVNSGAAATYLQLHDAAALTDVTLGTTVPTYVIAIAASAHKDRSLCKPLYFSLGLVMFSTTTPTGDTGAGTVVSLEYA